MRAFFDWYREDAPAGGQPWLILGKGPSFSLRTQFDLTPYRLLSINHAVRELPVDVAHVIDVDVIESCRDALLRNAKRVVMPWCPHVRNAPGSQTLEEWARTDPTLRQLDQEDRLLWYNLSSGRKPRPESPVIHVKYFSAEAVLNLLSAAGVRTIRSLGIDGGAGYSTSFNDLKDKTLLNNRWSTFNLQFAEMAKSMLRTGVDYSPLHLPHPIRVFVATSEKELLPARVLEYSIKKHTPMSIQVTPLCHAGIEVPLPKDAANLPRTPFSFQRFLIPGLAGYSGRAVYLDADMQVFRDFSDLWLRPLEDTEIVTVGNTEDPTRRPQFSVMLLNCDLLKWKIGEIVDALDAHKFTYEQLMYEMAVATRIRTDLGPEWNSLEKFDPETTGLLHYTDMPTQPWIHPYHPLGHLWIRDLIEAVDLGHIPLSFLEEEVRKGHVRPSLLPQIRERIDEGLLLPREMLALDRAFKAPFHSIPGKRLLSGHRSIAVLRARLRSMYHHSPLPRIVDGLRRRLSQRR